MTAAEATTTAPTESGRTLALGVSQIFLQENWIAGLTMLMWVLLLMMGESGLVALTRAMGTLSTSGISPVNGPAGQGSGVPGEVVIFLFLIPALSRRFWPGGRELSTGDSWLEDPELRMAAGVVLLVSVMLFVLVTPLVSVMLLVSLNGTLPLT